MNNIILELKDVLQAITSSCPNLEELHLGRRTSSYHQAIFDREKPDEEAYRNIFALKRLKKLTFSGVEFIRGQFLQQVTYIILPEIPFKEFELNSSLPEIPFKDILNFFPNQTCIFNFM